MIKLKSLALCLALALLASCATQPRPAAALIVTLGPEKDGVASLRISGGPLQTATIVGDATRDGDAWRLSLSELKWFNNWANGWTEASFLLEGSARLEPEAKSGAEPAGWRLGLEQAPQLDSVESGAIRYFNTYLRGDQGRTEFSHRWDRIQAVSRDLLAKASAAELLKDRRALMSALGPRIKDGALQRDYKESPGLLSLAIAWQDYWGQGELPMAMRNK